MKEEPQTHNKKATFILTDQSLSNKPLNEKKKFHPKNEEFPIITNMKEKFLNSETKKAAPFSAARLTLNKWRQYAFQNNS